ncbi:MAG: hypothetical protein AB7U63_07595 [Porticoccaceae bacterium]
MAYLTPLLLDFQGKPIAAQVITWRLHADSDGGMAKTAPAADFVKIRGRKKKGIKLEWH